MPERSNWTINSSIPSAMSAFIRRSTALVATAVLLTACSQTETTKATSQAEVIPKAAGVADNQTLPAVAPNAQKDLYPEERVYTDTLKGYETKEYVFSVSAGQHVDIQFNTDNPSSYFNVTPEGSRTAIFIGSMSGAHFDQTFTAAGDYKVLVYLMRNAARRNETASYDLQIRLSGKLPAEGPEPLARSRMHPSWDVNNDGVNDCEQDGSCDHTVDYSKPRP